MDSTIATPLSPGATRVLLLGSGELGKEVAIELQRLGVDGYDRTEYGEQAGSAIEAFCRRRAAARAPCGASGVAALQDVVDEAHHAGSFARLFPPPGGKGCGRYCEFLQAEDATNVAGSADDQLTWAFLKAHSGLLPPRSRLPPSRADRRKDRAAGGDG